jgi:hypothetical protein
VSEPQRVGLEIGPRRKVVAQVIGWPGWCRIARNEEAAIQALIAIGPRFATVARAAGLPVDPPGDASGFNLVERIAGSSTSDFGAPSRLLASDLAPIEWADRDRWAALLAASWAAFDAALARVPARERGIKPSTGRAPNAMRHHVVDTDVMHRSAFGPAYREVPSDDASVVAAERDVRASLLAAFVAIPPGAVPEPRRRYGFPWTPRFAVRRAAWHALDHAWELEDRRRPKV